MSIRPHSAMDERTRVRMYERTGSTRTRSLDVEHCTLHLGTGAVNPQSSISDLQCVGCPLPTAFRSYAICNLQSPICNLYAAHCRLLSGPMQSAIFNLQSEIERRSSLRVASRLTPYGEGSDSAVFAKTVRVYARTNVRDQLGSVLRTSNIAP
jgi:hypothetical protein